MLLAPLAVSHAATNAPAPAKTSVAGYADPGLGTREEKKTTAVTDPAILDLSLEPPLVNTKPGPEYQDEKREFTGAFSGIDRTPGGRLWAGEPEKNFHGSMADVRLYRGLLTEQEIEKIMSETPMGKAK